jgi:excisionase family DNA binding protein
MAIPEVVGTANLPDLLTVGEAARHLRVPKSWVYERTRTREIPVRKLGRHVRIPREPFLEWIENDGKGVAE